MDCEDAKDIEKNFEIWLW